MLDADVGDDPPDGAARGTSRTDVPHLPVRQQYVIVDRSHDAAVTISAMNRNAPTDSHNSPLEH